MIDFFEHHPAAAWGLCLTLISMTVIVMRSLSGAVKWFILGKLTEVEEAMRLLAIRVGAGEVALSEVKTQVTIVDDRTRRLEPLIEALNARLRDHTDTLGDFKAIVAELRITTEYQSEHTKTIGERFEEFQKSVLAVIGDRRHKATT
jgi:hypothetical protein